MYRLTFDVRVHEGSEDDVGLGVHVLVDDAGRLVDLAKFEQFTPDEDPISFINETSCASVQYYISHGNVSARAQLYSSVSKGFRFDI